jgi:hypothetical protein
VASRANRPEKPLPEGNYERASGRVGLAELHGVGTRKVVFFISYGVSEVCHGNIIKSRTIPQNNDRLVKKNYCFAREMQTYVNSENSL